MPFADHHDMVKAFPSNRSNHALGIGVSPGRAWRNNRFPDVQRLSLTRKSLSVDLVSITDQMAWGLLQPAPLDQLPGGPPSGRMLGDIEMHQPAPVVPQHHEHEQDPKGRRGHREEIQRDQILGVILQKRAPRLRRRPPRPDHELRNRRLRYRQAQLQELAVNPRRTPERIGAADPPNEISELRPDRGPTASASTLPRPVAPEPLPVPADHGLWPHQLQRIPPALPEPRQHNPEEQFRHRVKGMRIEEVLTAPDSPWQNPFAERLIGSIRRECLDHVVVLGERHLRRILARYFSYYHRARTHLALDKDAPDFRPVELPEAGRIVEILEVGGLHHRYLRQAA